MISTVLEGATILDGTGRPAFSTDIAIVDERIAIVGDCRDREARRRLDCRGSVATPGFIDACSHTADQWLTMPRANTKTAQGVATEITPVFKHSLQTRWDERLRFEQFFDLAKRSGHGTKGSFLTDGDVRAACEAGATGVIIDRKTATFDDAVQLARQAAEGGAPRAVLLLRDYGDEVLEAIDEAVALAERASVHVHVAELRVEFARNAGRMERILERIDRARSRGAALSCDVFPYVATWIDLASLLPPRVTRDMLADEAVCSAVALEMHARLGEVWHELMLASVGSEARMDWCGMRFDEIARQMRLSPARAVLSFVASEEAGARAFFFCLREDDVATALSAEFCALASAAPAYRLDASHFGFVHPRAYGSFARLFGRYVRQRRTLTREEAVRRMTSLPARIFSLDGRGTIAEGASADINVFDADVLADTATYDRPYSLPVGMRYTFVDGTQLVGTTP